MKELSIAATIENIAPVTDFVNCELEALSCSERIRSQIDVAIDELFGNIAQYAYGSDVGPATVRVEVVEEPLAVVITFIDNGMPYDPLTQAEPDIHAPLEARQAGGLGIFLVRQTMDDVTYEYKNGQNILKVRKRLR